MEENLVSGIHILLGANKQFDATMILATCRPLIAECRKANIDDQLIKLIRILLVGYLFPPERPFSYVHNGDTTACFLSELSDAIHH